MSQKINPINNKLGVLQIWNLKFQKYGRTFKGYSKLIQPRNYILIYLKRFLFQNHLLIESIEFLQSNQQTLIKVFIFKLKFFQLQTKVLLNIISYWLKCPVKLLVYQKSNLNNSSFLVANYILYLVFKKTNSSKQILQIIYSTLKEQSCKTKVVYTIRGLQLVQLKGFKLEFTGCFESSRSQMSKTLKCSFGSVPLTKLNGYVDYSSNYFLTKFGSCGFKLWLFYELL